MTKLFITAGCSFSMVPYFNNEVSWVQYMATNYFHDADINHIFKCGCGNGLISRSLIKQITESLKEYSPEEILVGVMWSSADRQEVFSKDPQLDFHRIDSGPGYQNPQNIKMDMNNNESDRNYYMINSSFHSGDEYCTLYYKQLYDASAVQIISLEHILRTQLLLKSLNVKYFFMSYGPSTLPSHSDTKSCDIEYIYNLIDWNNYIPTDMQTFCDQSGLPTLDNDKHPSGVQNQMYCDKVILPHLKNQGYL